MLTLTAKKPRQVASSKKAAASKKVEAAAAAPAVLESEVFANAELSPDAQKSESPSQEDLTRICEPSPPCSVGAEEVSSYELEREVRIRANADYLRSLGLAASSSSISAGLPLPPLRRRQIKRKVAPEKFAIETGPARKSRRLCGEEPEIKNDSDILAVLLPEEPTPVEIVERGSYSKSFWRGRKQTVGLDVAYEVPECVAVPLTLLSIETTILELGELVQGPRAKNFWSNKGCLFKHPYPVGYKAAKRHFGNSYTMEILDGGNAPVFKLTLDGTARSWVGNTPTYPWTQACLQSKSTGTRVSGPLFFGFSDPITQKLIEMLPGYKSWEQVKEEAAAAEMAEAEQSEK